jgi:hypothetical protein
VEATNGLGINPLVIPNGLPRAISEEADSRQVARLKNLQSKLEYQAEVQGIIP